MLEKRLIPTQERLRYSHALFREGALAGRSPNGAVGAWLRASIRNDTRFGRIGEHQRINTMA